MTNKQKTAAVISIGVLTVLLCVGAFTAVKCVNAGGHWHVLWCTQDK